MARMAALAALAAEAGVVLLHENEKGIYRRHSRSVCWTSWNPSNSPALRIAWDNANFVQVGVKPYTEGYAMLRPYLEYFQVKDAVAATGRGGPLRRGRRRTGRHHRRPQGGRLTAGFASLEPHLASAHELGGFSGPVAFGNAARAFAALAAKNSGLNSLAAAPPLGTEGTPMPKAAVIGCGDVSAVHFEALAKLDGADPGCGLRLGSGSGWPRAVAARGVPGFADHLTCSRRSAPGRGAHLHPA